MGIEVTQIADQPTIVEHSISEFVETFVEALGIVLLVSFLALGWRAGIVVALSVPLVLSIVLTVMYAAGIDLHRITLGALIIALGLLVDDAIIDVENMVRRFRLIDDAFRRLAPRYPNTIVIDRDSKEFHERQGLLDIIADARLPMFTEIPYRIV